MFRVGASVVAMPPSLARPVFSHLLSFSVVLVDLVLQAHEDGVVFIFGGKTVEDLPLTLRYRRHILCVVVVGWRILARPDLFARTSCTWKQQAYDLHVKWSRQIRQACGISRKLKIVNQRASK